MEIEKQDGGYQGLGREENGELLLRGTEFQVYEVKSPGDGWWSLYNIVNVLTTIKPYT